ncbi:ABC transporter substrate-binding protein [Pullulanibacillus camelliae]|nr:extracellular solute-binding protein [Pullulanibacillus camelliae]
MKKWLMSTVLLILVFSLAACSSDSKSSSGNSHIKVVSKMKGTVRVALAGWQLDNGIDALTGKKTEGLKEYLKKEFSPRYPNIKVKLTQVPWENAKAKQTAMLKSGDADVLYSGGAFAFSWYQQGLLKDLNPLIDKDKAFDPDIYLKGLWENAYSTRAPDRKTQFGIPVALGRRAIGYDKKLFKEWGVEPLSDNPTPEEILSKAKQMTGKNPKTGKQNYGLWWEGNGLNDSTAVALSYAFGAKGAEGRLDKLGDLKWELNAPEMVKVMEWLKEASQYAPKAFVNGKGNEKWATKDNDIAIYLDCTGGTLMSNYLQSKDESLLDRFQPTMNMGPDGRGWVAVDPFVMAKNAKNVDASWEVMKFLTNYDTQKYMYDNFNQSPTLAKADFVNKKDAFLQKELAIAKITKPTLLDEANPYFSSDIIPEINGFISKAANGKAPDIQSFLDDVQKRAEKWSADQ